MKSSEIIKQLSLAPHIEGGYFRRTYCSEIEVKSKLKRRSMSSILYLLSHDSPVGFMHKNRSDIMHYYQLGSPITYYLLYPDGCLQTIVLGPDLANGQQLQLLVEGGVWKASVLHEGEFALVSEAVSPAFDYEDMVLADENSMRKDFPQLWARISPLIKPA